MNWFSTIYVDDFHFDRRNVTQIKCSRKTSRTKSQENWFGRRRDHLALSDFDICGMEMYRIQRNMYLFRCDMFLDNNIRSLANIRHLSIGKMGQLVVWRVGRERCRQNCKIMMLPRRASYQLAHTELEDRCEIAISARCYKPSGAIWWHRAHITI